MSKLIYGVGINDADYSVNPRINGGRSYCVFYQKWHGMLKRCYSEAFQKKNPTYIGCSVSSEWLSFMTFKLWMVNQQWEGNQIDKDLLFNGNKIYSPEKCVFVSQKTNSLLTDCGTGRGDWPIGVSWHIRDKLFISRCSNGKKDIYLGCFNNKLDAHLAWQKYKKDLIYSAAIEQDDERVKNALLSRCEQLQYDIDNGLETTKL